MSNSRGEVEIYEGPSDRTVLLWFVGVFLVLGGLLEWYVVYPIGRQQAYWDQRHSIHERFEQLRSEFYLEVDRQELKVRKAKIPWSREMEFQFEIRRIKGTFEREMDLIERELELELSRL